MGFLFGWVVEFGLYGNLEPGFRRAQRAHPT